MEKIPRGQLLFQGKSLINVDPGCYFKICIASKIDKSIKPIKRHHLLPVAKVGNRYYNI